MTLGAKGCLLAEKNGTEHISGFKAVPPLDIVGAGDSFHAAMAASLAAGADPKEAAIMGNLAAFVTIKKTGTTGTASPEEILKVYKDHKAKII
jgi:sugar/nucleoside kinase (ribokinase family)